MNNEAKKMLRVGLIGGVSYTSSAYYYQRLNELVNARLGGLHSSECVLVSLDLSDYAGFAERDDFDGLIDLVASRAEDAVRAGADFLVLCSNTAHKAVPSIAERVGAKVPVLHIADCAGREIRKRGWAKVGFIGTRYTMTKNFLTDRIRAYGVEVVVPSDPEVIAALQGIIEETSRNEFLAASQERVLHFIQQLHQQHNIEAVVAGCTELPLLLKSVQEKMVVPLIDPTELHVVAAAEIQLGAASVADYSSSSSSPSSSSVDSK
ncbi:Aspartate racemase [Balamuthia mandrillaris]